MLLILIILLILFGAAAVTGLIITAPGIRVAW